MTPFIEVRAVPGNESVVAFLREVGFDPAEVADEGFSIELGVNELVVRANVIRSAPLSSLAVLGGVRWPLSVSAVSS